MDSLIQTIIFYSDDLGGTWEEIVIDNPNSNITSIDQNEDYIVAGGRIGYTNYFISVSTNNGQSWTNITENLPWIMYNKIDNINIHNERLFVSSGQNNLWYRDDILTNISSFFTTL